MMGQRFTVRRFLLVFIAVSTVSMGCAKSKTKLVYYGFDDRKEVPEDAIRLAQTWSNDPPCSHWRATINRKDADYQVLFGDTDITIVGRRGEVLYSGGQGVLYLPHGNPDGSGINICKLTAE
jgi:hypothetical protein